MLTLSTPSVSNALDLNQALERLSASPFVDGIASFGSRAANQTDAVSDYDLLLPVTDLPARVFQMVTTIGGMIADIVPVETHVADAMLVAAGPPAPRSFEGLFAACQFLVATNVQPIGNVFTKGDTAIVLMDAENVEQNVNATLAFWNSLFSLV